MLQVNINVASYLSRLLSYTSPGMAELEALFKKYKLSANIYKSSGNIHTSHPSHGAFGGCWARKEFLGSGNFGEVHVEQHKRSNALRVVKKLSSGSKEKMRREVKCMVKVKAFQRQFVNFLGWYEVPDTMYIAMGYHPEGDLSQYIQTHGACEEGTARYITEQILQGVFVLHHEDINMMHRDIKPENILVDSISPVVTIKLADFGFAKVSGGSTQSALGTSEWAAPEQLDNHSGTYCTSADIWSVGCVAYYLLTSLNPFSNFDSSQDPEVIERYKFPSWPRLIRYEFCMKHVGEPGYFIAVRGASNEANGFLKRLIIPNPESRISALEALQHEWICPQGKNPLCTALEERDSPLFSLLRQKLGQKVDEVLLASAVSGGNKELVNLLRAEMVAQGNSQPHYINSLIVKHAAIHGHTELVREFMRESIGAWSPMEALTEALTEASAVGNLKIVHELLLYDPPESDIMGALISAAKSGHQDVVNCLWGRRTQLIVPVGFLLAVSGFGSRHVLGDLLAGREGPDISKALLAATEQGKLDNVDLILTTYWPCKSDWSKALLEAAKRGHRDVVARFLECYILDEELGVKVLTSACGSGNIELVNDLMERTLYPMPVKLEMVLQGNFTFTPLNVNRAIVGGIVFELIYSFEPERVVEWFSKAFGIDSSPCLRVMGCITAASAIHVGLVDWFRTYFESSAKYQDVKVQNEALLNASRFGTVELVVVEGVGIRSLCNALLVAVCYGHLGVVMILLDALKKEPYTADMEDALSFELHDWTQGEGWRFEHVIFELLRDFHLRNPHPFLQQVVDKLDNHILNEQKVKCGSGFVSTIE